MKVQISSYAIHKVSSMFCVYISGPSQGLKIRGGGARSTVVGIICPPG